MPLSDTTGGSRWKKHGKGWNRSKTELHISDLGVAISALGPTVNINLKANQMVWPHFAF